MTANDRTTITVFNDPGCPWGYSATPALRAIEWRYGDQLDWRLVLIGLTERAEQYAERGYTPVRMAQGWVGFRRFGMPFAAIAKAHVAATARACRAVVATRVLHPGREWHVLRSLQQANFTSGLVLDDDDQLRGVLARLDGIDADAVVGALDHDEVSLAYEADRAAAREAAGTAGALQGKTANTDGHERYTAPSVRLQRGDLRLEAAGFQPVEAYDVLVANLDPSLERRGPAGSAREVLEGLAGSPHGADATTAEVARIMAQGNDAPDLAAAELELIALEAEGAARRVALGDGATWVATRSS
jgi:2-hydroxychromene-2-carboxylate isomerase